MMRVEYDFATVEEATMNIPAEDRYNFVSVLNRFGEEWEEFTELAYNDASGWHFRCRWMDVDIYPTGVTVRC